MYYLTWIGNPELGQVSGLPHPWIKKVIIYWPKFFPSLHSSILQVLALFLDQLPSGRKVATEFQTPKTDTTTFRNRKRPSLVAKSLFPEALPQISLLPPNGQDSHIKTNLKKNNKKKLQARVIRIYTLSQDKITLPISKWEMRSQQNESK